MMLGGRGNEGVVMGGRGRDTGTAMGFGASVTGADTVLVVAAAEVAVATVFTGLAAVVAGAVAIAAGAVVVGAVAVAVAVAGVTGLTIAVVAGAEAAGADAVAATGADPAVAEAAEGAVAGALAGTEDRMPAVVATGVAGNVGVGIVAGVAATTGFAALEVLVGAAAGVGRTGAGLFAAVGGRASGMLGCGTAGIARGARGEGS